MKADVESSILIKVNTSTVSTPIVKNDDYTSVIIDERDGEFFASIYTKQEDTISTNIIVSRLLNALQIEDTTIDIKQTKINGVFYIPKESLNIFVFADLAMNNPTFREYIAVDERNRPRKQQNSVYARYEDRRTGEIMFTLTEKVADANTRAELRRTGVTFDNGEIYTRVKNIISDK